MVTSNSRVLLLYRESDILKMPPAKSMRKRQFEFDDIIGILDAQGFTDSDNKFLVRELSFASKKINQTIQFSTEIPEFLDNEKYLENGSLVKWRQTQQYQKYKVHGLSFDKLDGFPQECLVPFIKFIFKLAKDGEYSKFGVNNSQLEEILEAADIPFLNVQKDPGFSNSSKEEADSFIDSLKPCPDHEIYFEGMRCSAQKANGLWKWLQHFLNSLTRR